MRTLVRILVTRGAGDHDRLRVDHLSHDAAGGVCLRDQDLIQVKLLRRDALQASEERVGCRVRSGEKNTEPTEVRSEEWIHDSRGRECQAEDSGGARGGREDTD